MSGEIREDDLFTAPSGDIGNVSYEAPSFYGVFSTAPVSGGADIHDREYDEIDSELSLEELEEEEADDDEDDPEDEE